MELAPHVLYWTVKLLSHVLCVGEVMKHNVMKCILNEGMPTHKNPFEKGKLIITFQVQFPSNMPVSKIGQPEKLLPKREEVIVPDEAADCVLQRYDPDSQEEMERARQRREAYDSDDDEGMHGQRVQCASH